MKEKEADTEGVIGESVGYEMSKPSKEKVKEAQVEEKPAPKKKKKKERIKF